MVRRHREPREDVRGAGTERVLVVGREPAGGGPLRPVGALGRGPGEARVEAQRAPTALVRVQPPPGGQRVARHRDVDAHLDAGDSGERRRNLERADEQVCTGVRRASAAPVPNPGIGDAIAPAEIRARAGQHDAGRRHEQQAALDDRLRHPPASGRPRE